MTLLDEQEACLLLNATFHGQKGKHDFVQVQAWAFKNNNNYSHQQLCYDLKARWQRLITIFTQVQDDPLLKPPIVRKIPVQNFLHSYVRQPPTLQTMN